MKKYRGERGYRNYIKEANELKKPALFLAGFTALALILAGACFLYVRQNVTVVAYAEAVPVFVPAPQTPQILSLAGAVERLDMPPIIPVQWGVGIFFDTYTSTLFFPDDLGAFEVEHNYYYREHTVVFEDLYLPRRSFPLLPYNILPMRLLAEDNRIQIRTRRGALTEYGQSYIQIIDPRERYRTVVVIDPGHGGHDPGAPSALRNGPSEAEIVLNISQKILEIFDQAHSDILLIPTRTCDYFLSTRARTRIANSIGDYFVSIHCNADARSSRSNGTLMLYGTADGSYDLARTFQDALVSALQSPDRGIHYAPQFHILRESQIPVVILELLFQSNPTEAARLADPYVQLLIAQTIADTIANF
ncbi:MAG: N-acetylmuramoyl-L-alanine amidase [Defluviitaleaceae bacterium]|nr:N-acetylmuramoyl-L-alanine amidase [Defluviitaleaceae bacterium]